MFEWLTTFLHTVEKHLEDIEEMTLEDVREVEFNCNGPHLFSPHYFFLVTTDYNQHWFFVESDGETLDVYTSFTEREAEEWRNNYA